MTTPNMKVIEGGKAPKSIDRWPNAPKGLLPILRDPRIVDFSDESIPGVPSDSHDGYWIYTQGWTDRSNPGCHTWHEWTVRDLIKAWDNGRDLVRCAKGCDCGWDRE